MSNPMLDDETVLEIVQHGLPWFRVGPDLWRWTHENAPGVPCVHEHTTAEVLEFGPIEDRVRGHG